MRDSLHRGRAGFRDLIDRRSFLGGALVGATTLLGWPVSALPGGPSGLSAALEEKLASSPYVYVSPLLSDEAESTCHGEVWYGWIDGSVVVITSTKSWKARSVARGLGSARIWVGDYGRWKQLIGRNEDFRAGPSFDARAAVTKDPKLLETLIAHYETRYPDEIGKWRDGMRGGFHDGTRILIRYTPS